MTSCELFVVLLPICHQNCAAKRSTRALPVTFGLLVFCFILLYLARNLSRRELKWTSSGRSIEASLSSPGAPILTTLRRLTALMEATSEIPASPDQPHRPKRSLSVQSLPQWDPKHAHNKACSEDYQPNSHNNID